MGKRTIGFEQNRATFGDGYEGLALDGTPSDCVRVALLGAVTPVPDLVVSGINLAAPFFAVYGREALGFPAAAAGRLFRCRWPGSSPGAWPGRASPTSGATGCWS